MNTNSAIAHIDLIFLERRIVHIDVKIKKSPVIRQVLNISSLANIAC